MCHIAEGHYTGLHTQQALLVPSNPLDLLYIDIMNTDPSKGSKEDVSTDALTKFIQTFVTNSWKAPTIIKILVDKWICIYGIPSQIHSNKVTIFRMIFCHTST